jgi:hypothetical protein
MPLSLLLILQSLRNGHWQTIFVGTLMIYVGWEWQIGIGLAELKGSAFVFHCVDCYVQSSDL